MASAEPATVEFQSRTTVEDISSEPEAGQSIGHQGKSYTTIKEGLAYILVPDGTPTSTDPKLSKEEAQKQQVFYNPIQQFNRDLSVLAIKTFGNDLVLRRQQKHEQQLKKANRKKRKLQVEAHADGQAGDQELDDANYTNSKRRRTENGHAQATVEGQEQSAVEKDIVPSSTHVENGAESHPSQEQPKWKPHFTILDALSATGLRALRYAQEIPSSTAITANDLSQKATESIALNVKHNKLEDKITTNTGNAIAHMYSFVDKKGYDVIDLDPYGTACPFLDAAIQAVNDEGLLCVTCTDSAIFASHGYLEKTYSQYGGLPLKGEPCHEGGLRLLLHAIASSAARYGMAVEPLLSLSIDYYIRVFVRVRKSATDVKMLAGKTMIVYHCQNGCGSWSTQFLARNKPRENRDGTSSYKHSFAQGPSANEFCTHCGYKTHLSGPMYGGPLHNVDFIERILAQLNEVDRETYPTMGRIEGMLHTAREEITFGAKAEVAAKSQESKQLDPLIPKADPAEIDHHPFFFIPSSVSKVVHCSAPSLAAVRGALRHAGFKVTMSHCKPGTIRTTAPWTAIWHIMLEWVRQKAPLKNRLKKQSAGYAIMSKGSAHQLAKDDKEGSEITTTSVEEAAASASEATLSQAQGGQAASTEAEPELGPPSYMGTNFEVNFDEELGKDHDRGKYVRYQLAPRENWGPMSRAK
ncbi:TRM-domain-containing protein [Lophiostoma macrostomum CBS 122681]|uniref:tRNA (guanine(26)-N(2))-dimethyltransferase n=1 Tax=Lophiostoma macrostomum CBS 122681 TaxID=1314788 RepID=A0A6A6TN33_9PLEO|nr:TRM-domain-containing protein [Lophiostoma macrostomum CBS 122681]